ncbi:hypothetical protein JCM12856_25050 [Spirochaeta dissipatitropha]
MHMKNLSLYIDLDGVLADFDAGVEKLFGRKPDVLPPPVLWSRLAKTEGFYEHLTWMPDGKELWNALKIYNPSILTGLPRGKWAEPQKRAWCARELGTEIDVITCMSRDKHLIAQEAAQNGLIPVLIDDRLKLKDSWTEAGGVFIHHKNTELSLKEFDELYATIQ